jgi:uncharacterized phage protein gp47/JayE
MPFSRPSLLELRARTLAQLQGNIRGADTALRRAVLPVLGDVVAGLSQMELGYLDWIVGQLLPDTAQGEYLYRWGRLKGLVPNGASFAAGNVVVTGTPGLVLPAGTVAGRSDGAQFASTAAIIIGAAGTVSMPIEAVTAGSAGNTAPGGSLTLATAIIGVTPSVTVDANGLTGGQDAESFDSYRARLLNLLRQPPQGGNRNDFEQWALKVPGVTRAWAYPKNRGLGTCDLTFVMDGRVDIIPTAFDLAVVQAALDAQRPCFGDCVVFAPTAYPVNLTIHGLTPSTPTLRAAIAASQADLLTATAIPGGMVPFYLIDLAVAAIPGITYYHLAAPVDDVVVPMGAIAVPGTIAWS